MDKTLIYQFLIAITLIICGIMDFRNHEFNSLPIIICAAAGIFLSGHIVMCVLTIVSCIFLRKLPVKEVGPGDVDALLLITTGNTMLIAPIGLTACILALIYMLFKKTRSVPFVAMLAIGSVAGAIINIVRSCAK